MNRRVVPPALATLLLLPGVPVRQNCASPVFDRTVQVLEQRYFDRGFREHALPDLAERLRPRARAACTLSEHRQVTFDLLSEIPASHLSLISGPSYRHLLDELWARPSLTVGFELLEVEGGQYAGNVLDGGPAARAGLLTGDRVVAVDGHPVEQSPRLDWRTDDAYLDDPPTRGLLVEDGEAVTLEIERRPGERQVLQVPAEPYSLLRALEASARVVRRSGVSVGYVHVWMVHLRGVPEALERLFAGELAHADALVIDLRGRGGNGAMITRLLDVLDRTTAGGRPLVALIDRSARSAKDVIAYELRRSNRAVLVGERTAGAAIPAVFQDVGDDTYLMFPTVRYPRYTDLLELQGVEPHLHVAPAGPFGAGHDPILEAGLDEAARLAQAKRPTCFTASTETAPDYCRVLEGMVRAMGGESVVRARTAMTLTGTFEIVGTPVRGTIVTRSAAPHRLLVTIDLPGMGRISQGYDGQTGWAENPGTGNTVLEGRALQQFRNEANFFGPLRYEAHYDAIELAGTSEFDDRPCYELHLTYGDGRVQTVFVDAETLLPAGTKDLVEMAGGEVETTAFLSNYREFDGLKIATVQRVDFGGIQQQKIVITDVSFEPHPTGTFDPPAWVK